MTDDHHHKYKVWEPFLLSLFLALGMIVGLKIQKNSPPATKAKNEEASVRTPGKVEQLLRYIESKYVDEKDGNVLSEKAIEAILAELDPHSKYIPQKYLQQIDDDMRGKYVGIGLEKLKVKNRIIVSRVFPESPSAEAHIIPGDEIIAVNDSIVANDISEDSLIDIMRGEEGTSIRLSLRKIESGDTIDIVLERQEIDLPSLDYFVEIRDGVGLIKINRFSGETYSEFMKALEALKEEGIEDLVIDVRDNPGGYLQETVKILSQLVARDEELLVYTKGEHSKKMDYKASGRKFFELDDIVVLIDRGSASASEILAGAIQDLDRGVIVGRRSYGKGLVQEQYPLSDGSAVRLTTSRYYTPAGRLIQRDYSNKEEYDEEFRERQRSGEYYSEDSIHYHDTTKYFTSTGREVLGGGGIVPDVFVATQNPFDQAQWSRVISHLKKYLLDHLGELYAALPRGETKDMKPEKSRLPLLDFYKELDTLISLNRTDFSEEIIERHALALLTRMKHNDDDKYYEVLYRSDDDLAKALELIEKEEVDEITR